MIFDIFVLVADVDMTLVLLFLSKQEAARTLMLAMFAVVEVTSVRLCLSSLLFLVIPLGADANSCRPLRKDPA